MAKTILSETERGASEWVQVIRGVRWALISGYRERMRWTPFQVMMGRAPPTALSVLAFVVETGWDVDRLDEERVRGTVSELVHAEEKLHQDALQRMAAERQ